MKVVLATGGSGGHLIPALKVAQELMLAHDVSLIGSFKNQKMLFDSYNFKVYQHKAIGLNFDINLFRFLFSCFFMLIAVVQMLFLLKRIKPDVICGFGGYGAFPVVLAATILQIPALIHEQNVIPGRANRWLSKKVQKVLISFHQTKKYFLNNNLKIVLTGCPANTKVADKSINEIYKDFNFINKRVTILVFGGSHGSKSINECFQKTVKELKIKKGFQVIHIVGKGSIEKIKREYEVNSIFCAVFEYWEDMASVYRISDLVISRAGALSVTEIDYFKIPAILIPYPFAGGHQMANAKALESDQITIIEEKDLSVQSLAKEIKGFLDKEYIKSTEVEGVLSNAVDKIVNEITSLS